VFYYEKLFYVNTDSKYMISLGTSQTSLTSSIIHGYFITDVEAKTINSYLVI